jgi:micrococcal nuclease
MANDPRKSGHGMPRRNSFRPVFPGRFFRRRGGMLLVLILAAVLLWQWWIGNLPFPSAVPNIADSGEVRVERTVDGDTLVLADRERVRLIGVNAPETVKPNSPVEPWGPEASAFTRNFVGGGIVHLQFDGPRRDQYGRLLAYVWVNDRMLNEELLRAGLARYEPQYHYSGAMKSRFRKAQEEAQAARRGIWSGKEGRGLRSED